MCRNGTYILVCTGALLFLAVGVTMSRDLDVLLQKRRAASPIFNYPSCRLIHEGQTLEHSSFLKRKSSSVILAHQYLTY